MKYLIEPCCASRHLMTVRDAIAKGGDAEIEGFGDLSLAELLPAILTRYSDTDMMIVAPFLPDQAAEAVASWMHHQWSRSDGRGKVDVIRHLTVIADLSGRRSPAAHRWIRTSPFGDRLTLVDTKQDETAILLPDFAIVGPVNLRYGEHFTARATTKAGDIAALWEKFSGAGIQDVADVAADTDTDAVSEASSAAAEDITTPYAPVLPV